MGDIVSKFLSFDKLIGETLIKIVYFIGLAGILIGFVIGFFASFALIGTSFLAFLGQLVLLPIVAIFSLLFWRFICEMYILFFSLHNKVDTITAIAERTHPEVKPAADS